MSAVVNHLVLVETKNDDDFFNDFFIDEVFTRLERRLDLLQFFD